MNPSTGTFISMDEYAGSVFEPVSLHKYLYANANPVMYCDPSGYYADTKTLIGVAGTFAVAAILMQAYVSVSQAAMGTGASIAHDIHFDFSPATELTFNISEWELDFGTSAISKWWADAITIFTDPLPRAIIDPIPEHNFSNVLSFPTGVPLDYVIFEPVPTEQKIIVETFPVPAERGIGIITASENYYQKGKVAVPSGSIKTRSDVRNVTSEEFKQFIRSQRKTFKNSEWKKHMETWETEDGDEIEVHYWRNKSGEVWRHR